MTQERRTLFPCGRGRLPGSQGPGAAGSAEPITPVVIIPKPPDPPVDPPFIPQDPTGGGGGGSRPPFPAGPSAPPGDTKPTFFKCEIIEEQRCPPPFENIIARQRKECRPCIRVFLDPSGNQIIDPDCIKQTKVQCQQTCISPPPKACPEETGPGQSTPTPGTVAPAPPATQFFCQEFRTLCPGESDKWLEDPIPERRYKEFQRGCVPFSTNITPGFLTSGVTFGEGGAEIAYEIHFTGPFNSGPDCSAVCVNETRDCDVTTGGGGDPLGDPATGEPLTLSRTVVTPNEPSLSNNATTTQVQLTTVQQDLNAEIISVTPVVLDEDFVDLSRGVLKPSLFDPTFNFFTTRPLNNIELISNSNNTYLFGPEVTTQISDIVGKTNTSIPWDEYTLQNLTDDQLLKSLDPVLINKLQTIRFAGGEPVGVSVFLNTVRKLILEGRLDEIDVDFLKEAAGSQFDSSFEVLEQPPNAEYSARLAIDYLKNNLHTYQTNESTPWRNFQKNRFRPLNEDVNLSVDVFRLDGTQDTMKFSNDGVFVSAINPSSPVTVPSIGSPDRLNIGDGGGYYIDTTDKQLKRDGVLTDNIIEDAYYAPAAVRVKVLNMLGIDPALKITATSLENKHEFTAGDTGASATKPLFFALDLSSVTGDYVSDSLVESYSGNYSLLTASADIQRHMNNNALNTPMLAIDYRDPLYRYILDTSAFTLSLSDFNLIGFKDKGFSSIGSRFVNNIPFGLVVTPVAGGMFNPFNGASQLDSYGTTHTRSLEFLPALDADMEKTPAPMFRFYYLIEDGVERVGSVEARSTQNIGYRYVEEDFAKTFYSASAGTYGTSSQPASAYGTAYMLREVVDYLSATYSSTTFTWYDVYSRMPITQVGHMFFDSTRELLLDIANGFRGGITLENIESGYDSSKRVIPEDSKTIVTEQDRTDVTVTIL
mgnify:CR=1 FL=1